MAMNKPYKVSRRPDKSPIWQVLALLFGAVLVSLAIAGLWQTFSEDAKETPSSKAAQLSSLAPEISSAPPSSSEAVSSAPEPQATPMPEGAVPESERVRSTYFDDAVFVGDSITTGIELYGVMANTTVLAGTGINLDTVYTAQVVKLEDGSRIPIMDGLKDKQFAKVYVMLGGNEVRDESQEVFLSRYGKVIDDIRALQPDAALYIQSILPVTLNNKYNMDNTRIDSFNQALMGLCKEKQVYYLNVAECMKDTQGKLPDEASPADGMHFGPDYYNKWFTYLKTHVAGGAAAQHTESEPQETRSTTV